MELEKIEVVVREHTAVATVPVSDGPGDPHLFGYVAECGHHVYRGCRTVPARPAAKLCVPAAVDGAARTPEPAERKVDRQALGRLEAPVPQAPDTPLAGDSEGTDGPVLRTWAEVPERPTYVVTTTS